MPINDEGEEVGETKKPANVVGLFSRQPVEAAPPGGDGSADQAADENGIDQDAITMLEGLIERIKAGEFHGVALVTGILGEKGRLFDCSTFCSNLVTDTHTLSFLGAISMLERRVRDDMEGIPPYIEGDDDPFE